MKKLSFRAHAAAALIGIMAIGLASTLGEEPRSIAALAKKKRDIAKSNFAACMLELQEKPLRPLGEIYESARVWSRRWADSEQEMTNKQDERVGALEEHIKRLTGLLKSADILSVGGSLSGEHGAALEYDRLEAEVALRRIKDTKP